MTFPRILKLFLCASALLLAPTSVGWSQEVLDSIAAVVDDEIILESDIAYGMNTLMLEQGIRYPDEAQIKDIRDQVLDLFITQKVLYQQALEETLKVEERTVDKDLERKMQNLITQVGGEDKLVEYYGRPLRQIKRELRKGARESILVEMLKQRRLASAQVRRQEVRQFFEEHQKELPELPERVVISHILLEVKPSAEAQAQAEQRINTASELIQSGADFDSLARALSEDPSASQGGRLGFTERGDLVPAYEAAAFALNIGEISRPVKTQYGLHIIRLLDRQGERISTQHILIKLTPTAEDRDRTIQFADSLRQLIEGGEDFAKLAKAYSNDEESAAKGGRLDELLVTNLPPELKDVVAGMEEGELSRPVETSFGVHIIRLDKRFPARPMDLNKDWQTIEQYALALKRDQMFRDWIEEIKKEHYIWPEEALKSTKP
ncbi:MAG: peptidylprolyl isomerase [Calditrichota bacterium]